jgi:hypothetical protein
VPCSFPKENQRNRSGLAIRDPSPEGQLPQFDPVDLGRRVGFCIWGPRFESADGGMSEARGFLLDLGAPTGFLFGSVALAGLVRFRPGSLPGGCLRQSGPARAAVYSGRLTKAPSADLRRATGRRSSVPIVHESKWLGNVSKSARAWSSFRGLLHPYGRRDF